MDSKTLKCLWDVVDACDAISEFIENKQFQDYIEDDLLRSGIERKLTIIGEALFQAEKIDSDLTNRISEIHKIIGFRHVLIHGYSEIKDEIVWSIVKEKLPVLQKEARNILERH